VGVDREKKSISVSFRVSPRFKRALQRAADSERRTQTNFLETIVFDYCKNNDIAIDTESENKKARKRE
jgi:predicted transcriptional regulator